MLACERLILLLRKTNIPITKSCTYSCIVCVQHIFHHSEQIKYENAQPYKKNSDNYHKHCFKVNQQRGHQHSEKQQQFQWGEISPWCRSADTPLSHSRCEGPCPHIRWTGRWWRWATWPPGRCWSPAGRHGTWKRAARDEAVVIRNKRRHVCCLCKRTKTDEWVSETFYKKI